MKTIKFFNPFFFLLLGSLIFSSCAKDNDLQEVAQVSSEPTIQAKDLAPPDSCPVTFEFVGTNPEGFDWQLDIVRLSCVDNGNSTHIATYNYVNTDPGDTFTLHLDHDNVYYLVGTLIGNAQSFDLIYTDPQGVSHNIEVPHAFSPNPVEIPSIHVLCPGIEWLLC